MVMFLIPFAIVGYNMWERHKREEEERRKEETAEAPEAGRPIILAIEAEKQQSCDDVLVKVRKSVTSLTDDESVSVGGNVEVEADGLTAPVQNRTQSVARQEPPKQRRGIFRFVKEQPQQQQQRPKRDPFVIQVDKENLTYEVLGNQGSNALPFPRIHYK